MLYLMICHVARPMVLMQANLSVTQCFELKQKISHLCNMNRLAVPNQYLDIAQNDRLDSPQAYPDASNGIPLAGIILFE